jgi:hypothetical protein
MSTASRGPVWIDPPRFWAAVAGKNEEEITALLNHIDELWQRADIEALQRFDFVTCVGYPYRSRRDPNSEQAA